MTTMITSCSMSCVTRRSSTADAGSSQKLRRWTVGPSTSARGRSPRNGSTTRLRNSPASTSDRSADGTGTDTRSGTPTEQQERPTQSSNTTSPHGPPRRLRSGREPGEFVFVPSSADAAEDDGVAMGFVYNRSTDRSDLVLLDGQTMETVATVHLPARVPHGFHGNWVPTEG